MNIADNYITKMTTITVSKEAIERDLLFNSQKNVPDLYKQIYYNNDDDRSMIFYLNISTDKEAGMVPFDIFVDKLLLDNDYIKYVGKKKDEIMMLFDSESKKCSIFTISFLKDKMEKYEVLKSK